MDQLLRPHDTSVCEAPGPTGGDVPTADLSGDRRRARQLIDAGRNAVARYRSRSAESFMRAMRQEGGQ
ncbi:MAG: hypothetical protein ACYSWT_13215 [Planctomycetota bacterium]|jgi:hypothetical protein